MYNLFIDDQIDDINLATGIAVRDPKKIDPSKDYVGVKTVKEAISYIEQHGAPEFISFDYDLGFDENGEPMESVKLAKWLIEKDLDHPGFLPKHFSYQVHSANINAKNNLDKLRQYLEIRAKV